MDAANRGRGRQQYSRLPVGVYGNNQKRCVCTIALYRRDCCGLGPPAHGPAVLRAVRRGGSGNQERLEPGERAAAQLLLAVGADAVLPGRGAAQVRA
jgi:hypothetical protein